MLSPVTIQALRQELKTLNEEKEKLRELEKAILLLISPDWTRYHDLRDIMEKRPLSPEEALEYEHLDALAKKEDAAESEIAEESVKPLVEKHEAVLESIDSTIEALKASPTSVDGVF